MIGDEIQSEKEPLKPNTKKITSLFICDKKKPIGIVHIHDCIRYVN